MYLTKEEEKMIQGEYGPAIEKAMKVIVKVGESLGAHRLIDIKHAHVSGLSYLTIGEPGLLFIKSLKEQGAKTKVFSTLNPVGMDLSNWQKLGITKDFAEKQHEIVKYMYDIGFQESLTCTPYLIRKPEPGEHLAWGESSAVGMVNTYYGAYTNREGGPLALMSAITGKTYKAGIHLPENRVPNIEIVLDDSVDFSDPGIAGIIGYLVGEKVGSGIPLIRPKIKPGFTAVKAYTAAAGASGSIAISVIEGVTPGYKELVKEAGSIEKIFIEKKEVIELLPDRNELPDLIFIGCPHADIDELMDLKRILDKCGEPSIPIWVSTSRYVYDIAAQHGVIEALEKKNVLVIRDTCPVVSPATRRRFKKIATTSSKSYFYLPRMQKSPTIVIPFEWIGEYACKERN